MMTQQAPAEISLRVPGERAYALVVRTALGGVAVLKDLDVDALDDLRMAADEAWDCLLHQGRCVKSVQVSVHDGGSLLTVSLEAEFSGETSADCADTTSNMTALSRAVLETLIPKVELFSQPCGCVRRIDLTLPKAM